MTSSYTYAEILRALQSLDNDRLRGLLVEASSELSRSGSLPRTSLLYKAFVKAGLPADSRPIAGAHTYDPASPVEHQIDALFWEWISAGLGLPEFETDPRTHATALSGMRITPRGKEALGGQPPHPASIHFPDSLSNLNEETRARLEDAAECLRSNLVRPAVVMLGLAYETAVLDVLPRFQIDKPPRLHAERLEKLLRQLDGSQLKDDKKRQARAALTVCRVVSDLRNDAAHPGPDTFDRVHVEQLIRDAPTWLRTLQNL